MKSKLGLGLLTLTFSAVSAGCTSLQSVSVTSVPAQRSRPIQASNDNVALFGIHFDNDFADEVLPDLQAQCPGGKVTGILSKYETYWYVLVERRKVSARAYCVYERDGSPTVVSRVEPRKVETPQGTAPEVAPRRAEPSEAVPREVESPPDEPLDSVRLPSEEDEP